MAEKHSCSLRKCHTGIIALILVFAMLCMLCSCAPDNSGFDGTRFKETRKISVMTDSSDPELEKMIHDSVLEDCNIDVVFIPSSYYIQDYGIVPDVAYSANTNKLTTYYRMNSILNIAPYLTDYGDSFPALKELLGEENIYSCSDDRSEVWYLTPKNDEPEAYVTFIRKDWLDKLGLDVPANIDEFHNCLVEFRDNADSLLDDGNSNIIPFFIDNEPNISCKPLFDSYFDTSIDDEMYYVNGYCRVTQNGYSEGLKTLNEWYLEERVQSLSAHIDGSNACGIRNGEKSSGKGEVVVVHIAVEIVGNIQLNGILASLQHFRSPYLGALLCPGTNGKRAIEV